MHRLPDIQDNMNWGRDLGGSSWPRRAAQKMERDGKKNERGKNHANAIHKGSTLISALRQC